MRHASARSLLISTETAMLDEDKAVLDKWRALRQNAFLTLSTARELERADNQFVHLDKEST